MKYCSAPLFIQKCYKCTFLRNFRQLKVLGMRYCPSPATFIHKTLQKFTFKKMYALKGTVSQELWWVLHFYEILDS